MRTVFVGEAPSRPVDVAFKGDTPHGSGRRLARLLGTTPEEMHARKDWAFVNLFEAPVAGWDADQAAVAAWRVCASVRAKWHRRPVAFVYLGRRVARAMNYDKPYFEVKAYLVPEYQATHVVVPHPSGRCRLWNDKKNVAKFRKVMREIGVLT